MSNYTDPNTLSDERISFLHAEAVDMVDRAVLATIDALERISQQVGI